MTPPAGSPPVIAGWNLTLRFGLELAMVGSGAVAIAAAVRPSFAFAFVALVAVQYASSWERVQWLAEA